VSGNVNSASDVGKKIIVVKNKPRRDVLLVSRDPLELLPSFFFLR
jgi:hypothetical protein